MEIIRYRELEEMRYPVGLYLKNNLPIIYFMAEILKERYSNQHVNLLCRGSSGAIIAGIISSRLPNSVISFIRKPHESSHDPSPFLITPSKVNIIVDDFISSGRTIYSIFEKLSTDVTIDCIIVSGTVSSLLDFKSNLLICQGLKKDW